MNATKGSSPLTTAWLFVFTVFLSVALSSFPAVSALAADKAADRQEATQLVEKARLTLDGFSFPCLRFCRSA